MKLLILISALLATALACSELNQECRVGAEFGQDGSCCRDAVCVITKDGHTGKCLASNLVDPVNCVLPHHFCSTDSDCCPPYQCLGRIPRCLA